MKNKVEEFQKMKQELSKFNDKIFEYVFENETYKKEIETLK